MRSRDKQTVICPVDEGLQYPAVWPKPSRGIGVSARADLLWVRRDISVLTLAVGVLSTGR